MKDLYLLAAANLALCAIIVFIAICRLNSMKTNVLLRVRCEYAALIGGAFAFGVQPWYGEWPGWGALCMSFSVASALICSGHAWRRGNEDAPPAVATTQSTPEVQQ